MNSLKLLAALLFLGVLGCARAGENGGLQQVDQCMATLDSSISGSLKNPPKLNGIKETIEWAYTHLPSDIQESFKRAAKEYMRNNAGQLMSFHAKEDSRFQDEIYKYTALELYGLKPYSDVPDCDIVIPDQVANSIDSLFNLSRGPLKQEFDKLGITEGFLVKKSILLMLTMQATGVDWKASWFASGK